MNKPQLRSLAMSAPVEIAVMGRGTGKTVMILAPKTSQCYLNTMPRSTGVILGATYTQLITRTLPELMRGFQMLGYENGKHFVFGKRPPDSWIKQWKWEGPYAPVLDYKYVLSWWNGAVGKLISQERAGSSNGVSIDWISGDELKLINRDKLNTELLPANRGLVPAFAKNIYHHGMTFTTDMPIGTSGRWILEMESKCDKENVNEIWKIQIAKYKLKGWLKNTTNSTLKREIAKQLVVLEEELNDLRKGLLYFHTASTLDNIHTLGVEYIKELLRNNSQFEFDTQILNLKPVKLEDGFYPDLDEDKHGYFAENEDYFDNAEYDPFTPVLDCRKDKDLNSRAPLHISLDWNRRIWPLTVGQVTRTEIKTINALHVLYPRKLKDVVQQFCDYYKPHKRKFVYFWYDHTAIGDMHETRMSDDVVDILRKNGWIVQEMYIGQQPRHEERYRMWGDLLTESGKYSRVYRTNRENCSKLTISKQLAGAEQRKNGFGKDKKTEHDPKFPAEESTHFSDAEDTFVFGILETDLYNGYERERGNGGIVTGRH